MTFRSYRLLAVFPLFAVFIGCQSEGTPETSSSDEADSDALVYDTGARWMPDGQSILFYTYRHDPEGAELYSVSMSDDSQRRLTESSYNEWWSDPSPGNGVVYVSSDHDRSERFGGSDIFELNLESGSMRRVSAPAEEGVFNIQPDLSPDGTRLLYSADFIGPKVNAEIMLVDLGSGETRNLTDSPAIDRSGKWNGDGSRIVFSSDRSGSFDLFTMDPDGSDMRQLTDFPGNESNPEWSPDGERIVYESDESGVSQLHVLDVETGTTSRLTTSSERDVLPDWSPDGNWIAFTSYRNGERDKGDIYIIRPDGTGERRMTPR